MTDINHESVARRIADRIRTEGVGTQDGAVTEYVELATNSPEDFDKVAFLVWEFMAGAD